VYGDGIDQPLARISSGTVSWYLTDWIGSVREIADNSTGAFVYEVRFNGFGQIVAEVSAANGDRLKWQGREIEIEFSQYYFRARYYDPATGRFTGEDPIASEPNLYRAMGNGPTNARDPMGLEAPSRSALLTGQYPNVQNPPVPPPTNTGNERVVPLTAWVRLPRPKEEYLSQDERRTYLPIFEQVHETLSKTAPTSMSESQKADLKTVNEIIGRLRTVSDYSTFQGNILINLTKSLQTVVVEWQEDSSAALPPTTPGKTGQPTSQAQAQDAILLALMLKVEQQRVASYSQSTSPDGEWRAWTPADQRASDWYYAQKAREEKERELREKERAFVERLLNNAFPGMRATDFEVITRADQAYAREWAQRLARMNPLERAVLATAQQFVVMLATAGLGKILTPSSAVGTGALAQTGGAVARAETATLNISRVFVVNRAGVAQAMVRFEFGGTALLFTESELNALVAYWRAAANRGAGSSAPPLGLSAPPARLALPAPVTRPGAAELQALRQRLGAGADQQTLAVGRTNVPGLQSQSFEGASTSIRTQAGQAPLPANRPIQSPNPHPRFSGHTEEVLANDFAAAVERANIPAASVQGDLYVHISNPAGVCNICAQGLRPGSTVPAGVVRQLSERYPNLTIRITAEGGPARPGMQEFIIRNGRVVE
jgi:RHS repeat-associated protein